jgi:hypothetical protein
MSLTFAPAFNRTETTRGPLNPEAIIKGVGSSLGRVSTPVPVVRAAFTCTAEPCSKTLGRASPNEVDAAIIIPLEMMSKKYHPSSVHHTTLPHSPVSEGSPESLVANRYRTAVEVGLTGG